MWSTLTDEYAVLFTGLDNIRIWQMLLEIWQANTTDDDNIVNQTHSFLKDVNKLKSRKCKTFFKTSISQHCDLLIYSEWLEKYCKKSMHLYNWLK